MLNYNYIYTNVLNYLLLYSSVIKCTLYHILCARFNLYDCLDKYIIILVTTYGLVQANSSYKRQELDRIKK